jgi:hypothetical protein
MEDALDIDGGDRRIVVVTRASALRVAHDDSAVCASSLVITVPSLLRDLGGKLSGTGG